MTKGQLTVQNPLVVDARQFCAIKYIAARTRINCATAIFNHKLVTTQVAVCSRSFLLPLPLGEGKELQDKNMTKGTLIVQDTVVAFTRVKQGDFISLTDIARVKNPAEPKDVVKNWLRTRSTVEYLGYGKKLTSRNLKGSNSTPLPNARHHPRRLRYASPPLALIPKP